MHIEVSEIPDIKHYMKDIIPLIERSDVTEVYNTESSNLIFTDGYNGRVPSQVTLKSNNIELMLTSIASLGRIELNPTNPSIATHIQLNGQKIRVQGLISPVVEKPIFSFRKHSKLVIKLDEYVKRGSITKEQYELINQFIKERKNILIAGATASGKTTLANAILDQISQLFPKERQIVIEDTKEIQTNCPDFVQLTTSTEVNAQKLLKYTLRLSPDRINIGELRDAAAYDLFEAWSTGHNGGIATIHSNDAEGAFRRAYRMASENETRSLIGFAAEAIDVIIYIKMLESPRIRKVTEILKVEVDSNDEPILTQLFNNNKR